MRILLALGILHGLLLAASAHAVQARSETTRIENCQPREPAGLAANLHECAGWASIPVFTAYGDHYSALALGVLGIGQQFAERPYTGGLHASMGPVVDWRFAEGQADPYAAIVRWRAVMPLHDAEAGSLKGNTQDSEDILVVSALRPGGPVSACHVAYIDAADMPYANSVARAAADRLAPGFRCGTDSVIHIDAVTAERLGLSGEMPERGPAQRPGTPTTGAGPDRAGPSAHPGGR